MNRLLVLLFISTCIYSCGGQVERPTETPIDTITTTSTNNEDTSAFLPIAGLLRDDLSKVETFAGGLLRKFTAGRKKDSAFIQSPQFRRLAEQFFLKELDSAYFQDHFKQTSFMDEATKTINFIYVPVVDTAESLRRAVVYIKPSSMATDNVDRIYMETVSSEGDTAIEKKLTWKLRKYFYVLTIKQPKTGDPITTMEKLIWDPEHFGDN